MGSTLGIDDEILDILGPAAGYGAVLSYEKYASLYLMYSIVMYVGYILASIGMLFLNRVARGAFLLLIIADNMTTLLSGVVVNFEGSALLYSILAMLDGAILALAYLSPLSEKFKSK
jgi:hypothetical protein